LISSVILWKFSILTDLAGNLHASLRLVASRG
jgi:hypothetical protein